MEIRRFSIVLPSDGSTWLTQREREFQASVHALVERAVFLGTGCVHRGLENFASARRLLIETRQTERETR